MKYEIKVLDPWQRIMDKAAESQDLTPTVITPAILRKALMAEHSMTRAVRLEIKITGIKTWLAWHFRTHEVGNKHDPMMRTQLPYALNPVKYDRDAARQDVPVNYTMDVNCQSLLNMMKKRLCIAAGPEVNAICIGIINKMRSMDDPFLTVLAYFCRPSCIWQGNECHETFKGKLAPCGRFPVKKRFSQPEPWWTE
ncbi:MAG: hypothetical protein DRP52_01100 [Planctomycetota bacterium]|nr:MAG: hypothetical protein DRP52_01100 [Planctomycetota bacterium]